MEIRRTEERMVVKTFESVCRGDFQFFEQEGVFTISIDAKAFHFAYTIPKDILSFFFDFRRSQAGGLIHFRLQTSLSDGIPEDRSTTLEWKNETSINYSYRYRRPGHEDSSKLEIPYVPRNEHSLGPIQLVYDFADAVVSRVFLEYTSAAGKMRFELEKDDRENSASGVSYSFAFPNRQLHLRLMTKEAV